MLRGRRKTTWPDRFCIGRSFMPPSTLRRVQSARNSASGAHKTIPSSAQLGLAQDEKGHLASWLERTKRERERSDPRNVYVLHRHNFISLYYLVFAPVIVVDKPKLKPGLKEQQQAQRLCGSS